jgi:Ca2+/H+ antiporter
LVVAGLARIVARRSLLLLFALGPLAVALDRLGAAGKLTIFLLAAAAVIPLAWLIGEATDNAAYYTGPGIGGFLNATFGNAPELIIALVAVSDGLTEVVRASLVGSIVGNLLLTNSLVGSLRTFASRAHLSQFLVAIVIVAIVGNATEHGSAVLLAKRGKVRLATEISLASSAQVAGLLIPLVALASWAIEPLALSFRPIELGALAVATALPALVLARGRTTRLGGLILLLAYVCLVAAFYSSGNR